MVGRKFRVRHKDSNFDVDYETADGFEVFKFQLFSLTAVPPHQQKIFGDDEYDRIVSDDSDLISISDKLRLVSIDDDDASALDSEAVKSDEQLARLLQAEEEALMFQQFAVSGDNGEFEPRIRPYIDQVHLYEDPHRQEAARKTVPIENLEEKALIALAKEGNLNPFRSERDHAFLLQLLYWFKQTFKWVNSPPCEGCGTETVNQGMGIANSSETAYGASRVELHRCKSCSRITRFPRYNDPIKLLETKKGRCGEWANCFSLYCRSFGYETRLILDFTDHVWTECYSIFLGRWMHLDPCEGIYDTPLLYEKGWNKKLNYTIAIAKDGVHDVTKRYTRKWHEVLSRRNITTEAAVTNILGKLTSECRRNLTSVISVLEERDRNEVEELNKNVHFQNNDSLSLPGRLSGDKEWRTLRSENGSDSLSSSSCPVRKCVDEHVSRIYNAFSPLISRLVEFSSKHKALEALHLIRTVLADLKKSPFKTRRVVIDLDVIRELLPCFNPMLDALSLKSKQESNGKVEICLADDPVKASLALPVVFHALDDVIYNIKQCDTLSKLSLSWPLLKLNRICSGSVLASGEELRFGIATSAFDGTRLSKWEEPNGAKGCWLIFKGTGDQVYELCSYELMSANDAPERDPKDCFLANILYPSNSKTGENKEGKSLFAANSGVCPDHTLFQKAHVYVIQNTEELIPYRERHKELLREKKPGKLRMAQLENEYSKCFPKWVREEVLPLIFIPKSKVCSSSVHVVRKCGITRAGQLRTQTVDSGNAQRFVDEELPTQYYKEFVINLRDELKNSHIDLAKVHQKHQTMKDMREVRKKIKVFDKVLMLLVLVVSLLCFIILDLLVGYVLKEASLNFEVMVFW